MVSKVKTISYGTAKLEYDANKIIGREHVASEACRHNLYGETPTEIAREMRDIQERSHPNLSKCYFDIVITLSESDSAKVQSQEECQQLVEEYMQRLMVVQLGLSEKQFASMQWIAYQHERTDHNGKLRHWHVLANRVLPDGTVVSDSNIGRKAVKVANDISRERGFTNAENVSQRNKAEIREAAFRTLKGMSCYSFEVFKVKMAREGFSVQEAYSKSGRLQGYYIASKSGTLYKASVIDRDLTLGRIENTWKLIHSGRYRQAMAAGHAHPIRRDSRNGTHIVPPSLSSVLNARVSNAHSRNREDEVGHNRRSYDDEYNENRNKGYSM